MVKLKLNNGEIISMGKKPSSLTKKIIDEFSKHGTIKLIDLYTTLSQDEELKHKQHLKHRIRSSMYHLKKLGKLELISKATYQIIK